MLVIMKPGSPEWHRKVEALLTEEATQPMGLWYLSFAEPHKFLGSVYVEARGYTSALQRTHRLGINPGGQVLHIPVPPEIAAIIPEERRNRLLSRAELEIMDKQWRTDRTAS